MKYLFIIFIILAFSGCEKGTVKYAADKNTNPEKNLPSESNKNNIKTSVYKGMYYYSPAFEHLKECGTKILFNIANDGDNFELRKVYNNAPGKNDTSKIYIEIEGFISEKTNDNSSKLDSVLVITKFLKFNFKNRCD